MWNFPVLDARGVGEFVRESAEAAAENQRHARTQLCSCENKFRGAVGLLELEAEPVRPFELATGSLQKHSHDRSRHQIRHGSREHRANAQFAPVRRVLIRRQRADAADLNSDRAEIRKSAQRERRDRKRARIERRLHRAEQMKTPRVR